MRKKLLIYYFHKNNKTFILLLSIALIEKFGFNISIENIENEFERYHKNDNEMSSIIINTIKQHQLNDKLNYNSLYQFYKKEDMLYDYKMDPISLQELKNQIDKQKLQDKSKITYNFYEGFGL